ncbi:hypothetical protein HDU67_008465 [Dinochytrium kinnereticum]|nr:hypothetical protein HDU67_008465 [Dinochytrium kinnereticum]
MAASKKALHAKDLARTLSRSGVPLNWHPSHPVRFETVVCFGSAGPENVCCMCADCLVLTDIGSLTHALYRAYWVDNEDVSDKKVLLRIAASAVPPHKFQYPLDDTIFQQESLAKKLAESTSRVVDLGGPGVPCFHVNQKLFWGQDRLHFVESQLAGIAIPQPRLNPVGVVRRPKKLTIFWDISSPWSFLAWTQTKRIQIEAGPQLSIEHVPILVGALFKEIGTPNVPMLTMAAVKREYGAKDMMDWNHYWSNLRYSDGSLPRKVELNFPSVFPIRSVTPSRVILVNPETTEAIFSAAWEKDIQVADADKLKEVLDRAGFNGEDLIKRASESTIKERLRENNDRALKLGLCGVPSFVVDDELFWGQDRINFVMDALHKDEVGAKM